MDKFHFYEGCKTIDEALENIEYLGLIKSRCYIIKFMDEYYPVFYHSSSREVIIGRQKVFYTHNGRLIEKDIRDAVIDFEITKRDKNEITKTLAVELNMIDEDLEVYYYPNINSKNVKKAVDMNYSKYVVILGVTFASKFYTFSNLDQINMYFSLSNELISFLISTKGAVAIDPFKQELEFVDGSVIPYKIIYYSDINYRTFPTFALIENNVFADDGKRHWISIARYQEMFPDDEIMFEQPDFREDTSTCKWCVSKLTGGKTSYCSSE